MVLLAAAGVGAIAGTAAAAGDGRGCEIGGVRREKSIGREADFAEEITWVVIALFNANLFRHAEIIYRNKHLHLSLQLNNHKDSECYLNDALSAVVVKAAVEAACDRARYAALTAGLAYSSKTSAKGNRFCNLAGDLGQVAAWGILHIIITADKIGSKYLYTSFAAEENSFFVVDTKTADFTRAADRRNGDLKTHAEVDGQINAVIAAVEGNRFGVDKHIDNLGAFELYGKGVVDELLILLDKEDLNIFKAFSVAAGIVDSAGVYAYGFFEAISAYR